MVMPVATIGPRAVSYFGQNTKGVPSTQANPGTAPDHVIVLSQLTETRASLESLINNVRAGDVGSETAARIAADLAVTQSLTAQINNIALQGIRQKVAVGARVTSIPTDLTSIPGFTPGATTPDGRLFVDSGDASSGFYQMVNGVLTRDPAFMTATDFQAGLMVWVDGNSAANANSFWTLTDPADGTGEEITAIFEPFGRMQDMVAAAGGALTIVGDTITWNYDSAFLAVVNGNATLSNIFKARIDTIESVANQATADIAQIKAVDSSQASAIAFLTTENQQQGTAISSVTTRTAAVESSVATNTTDLTVLTARTTATETTLTTKAAAADVTALGSRTTTLESTVATKASSAEVAVLTDRTTTVEGVAATNTGNLNLLTARTGTLETTVATKAAATDVTALATRTSATEASLDTKAAAADVVALTDRTTTVETTVATKASAADVTALTTRTTAAEQAIAALATVRILTGGVAELFTDTDGSKWTKTTFTVTFPANSKYRLLTTTLVAAPKATLSTHVQPTYPGNTCVLPFFTSVGSGDALMPVDNDVVEAMFVNFANPF